jgi:hypothetical protein
MSRGPSVAIPPVRILRRSPLRIFSFLQMAARAVESLEQKMKGSNDD